MYIKQKRKIPITKMGDTAIILYHDIAEIRHPHRKTF